MPFIKTDSNNREEHNRSYKSYILNKRLCREPPETELSRRANRQPSIL
jgi:hypothetical protein